MRRGIGGALLTVAVLGLSLLSGPASAVVPAESVSAAEPRKRDFLPHCATPQEMNCIESIEYLLDGDWKTADVTVNRWIISDDGQGNIVYGDEYYTYDTPGLVHEAGRTAVTAALVERDDINGPPYAAYQFQIHAFPYGNDVFYDPPIYRCQKDNPNVPGTDSCTRGPWLADTDYRFTFRSSTLVPIFARSSVMGLATSVQEMPGGFRVSVTGSPGPRQAVADQQVAGRTDTFDAVSYEWEGFIADARARNGVLAECQGLGIATAYSNGYGGFMPEWDARTGTLIFGTDGYHYGPDGNVYKGRAEIFVPGPLARCMWKVDPRQTVRMEIEVFTEGGGEETAGTKSIAYDAKADLVKMIAIDFTYSQKQIAARPTPIDARPGKKACDVTNTVCVTVDRLRKSAKVSIAKVTGASEVVAVALRGAREDGPQIGAPVKRGKASLTVKLSGAKSQGQIWVVRSPSTFISSFQVG